MRRHASFVSRIIGIILVTGGSSWIGAAQPNWPGMRGPSYDGAVHDAHHKFRRNNATPSRAWPSSSLAPCAPATRRQR